MIKFARLMTVYKIKKPAYFSFKECLWFLDRGLDDCMHTVVKGGVLKLLEIDGKPVLLKVSDTKDHLVITLLLGRVKNKKVIYDYMEDWFDLDRDLSPFYTLLKKDKDLVFLLNNYSGLRLIGIPDLFETLCWCVIGQQINLTFAYRVKRRLVEKYGQVLEHEGRTHFLFPSPEAIRKLSVTKLRELQLTEKKAEYLIGIAALFADGVLTKKKLKDLGDEKLMLTELIKIRGIGEWTANYAIMKSLRAMNGVPYGDSGVNQALYNLKGIPKKNNREMVDAIFNKFDGWKTYLVYYLWRSLRN
jgi:DNA-3-methyladenine glycosylase II